MNEYVPGEILLSKAGRRERVVAEVSHGVICLVKVGRSWTDPNPAACYDRSFVTNFFTRTGKFAPETLRRYFEDRDAWEARR